MSELCGDGPEGRGEAPQLSEAGRARREAMLPVLELALARRVTRRKLARTGAGVAAVAMIALGVAWNWPVRHAAPQPGSSIATVDPLPAADGSLAMRYASFHVIQGPADSIVEIDDDALLRELRAIGHPTGLIRTRGAVVLTADVGIKPTDPDEAPGKT